MKNISFFFIFITLNFFSQELMVGKEPGIYSCSHWKDKQELNSSEPPVAARMLSNTPSLLSSSCQTCNDPFCRDQYIVTTNSDWMYLNLNVVLHRDDAGYSSISIDLLEDILTATKNNFAQAHIGFYHKIIFVDNTSQLYTGTNTYDLQQGQGVNLHIYPSKSATFEIGTGGGGNAWLRPYDMIGFMGPSNVIDVVTGSNILTHEFGHALSLAHPFDGYYYTPDWTPTPTWLLYQPLPVPCGPHSINYPNQDLIGDLCSDTKPTYQIANISGPGCYHLMDGYDCNGTSWATAQLNGQADDLIDNFMQYGPANCKTTFTDQQIARMRCYIDNNILYSTSFIPNNVTADFESVNPHSTTSNMINFSDKSSANVTSYLWDFGDGTTSTLQNPTHTYASLGYFSVSLTVSNGGQTNTKTKTDYVYITNIGLGLPYSQNFEGLTSFPPIDWHVYNPDNDPVNWTNGTSVNYENYWKKIAWNSVPPAAISRQIIGHNGLPTNSAFTDQNIFDNTRKDYLYTPDFDLSSSCLNNPELSFYMSYLPSSDPTATSCGHNYPGFTPQVDTYGNPPLNPIANAYNQTNQTLQGIIGFHKNLNIYVSLDGGQTWSTNPIYSKSDNDLKTVNDECADGRFTPLLASHWRLENINLAPYIGNNKVRFRFEIYGDVITNSLYIDEVAIADANPQTTFLHTVSLTHVQCDTPSGAINIQVTGGTAPYQYSIDGGNTLSSNSIFTNLNPGQYAVYVKDANGCSVNSFENVLIQPLSFNILASANPSCNNSDGYISLQISNSSIQTFNYSVVGMNNNAQVFNAIGTSTGNNLIALSGLPFAQYSIHVDNNAGCVGDYVFNMGMPNNGTYTSTEVIPLVDQCGNGTGAMEFNISNPSNTAQLIVSHVNGPIVYSGPANQATIIVPNLFGGNYVVELYEASSNCTQLVGTFTILTGAGGPSANFVNLDEYCNLMNGQINMFLSPSFMPREVIVEKVFATPQLPVQIGVPTIFNGNNYTISSLSDGFYRIFVRNNGGIGDACRPWRIYYVTIGDANFNGVSIVSLHDPYCENDNSLYPLIGVPAGGTFTGLGVSGTTNQYFFTPSVAGAGTHTISYNYSGNLTCFGSAQNAVQVDPSSISFSGLSNTYCANPTQVVQLTGNPSGGTFSGPGVVGNTFNSTLAGPGLHTITYSYSSACGNLSATANTTITSLNVTLDGLDKYYCFNASPSTLIVSPTGGVFSGAGVVNGVFYPSLAGAGTHIISYTYTDNYGCTGTAEIETTVIPPVIAGLDVIICSGNPAILSATGALTYMWDNGLGLGQTHTVYPTQTTIYTVTGTDIDGCVTTDQVTVTVNPLPSVSAGADESVCDGQSTTLLATGASTYNWDYGQSLIDNYTVTPTQTTTYTVIGMDANGCSNSDDVTVTVNPLPVVDAGPDGVTICAGQPITLLASGASTYDWDNGQSLTASYTVAPTQTTTYTVVGTDANGCFNSDQIVVTVNPLPLVTLTATHQTLCSAGTPNTTVLTASGANSYSWTPNLGTSSTYSVSPTQTTTYTVIGTGLNTCVASSSITINVEPPTFSLGADRLVCRNTLITVGSTAINNNDLINYSYSWRRFANGQWTNILNNNSPSLQLIAGWAPTFQGYKFELCITHLASGCRFCDEVVIRTTQPCFKQREINGLSAIQVFPNPNKGEFSLSLDEGVEIQNIQIYDPLGRKLDFILQDNETYIKQIKLVNNVSGTYFLHIELDGEIREVVKLTILN